MATAKSRSELPWLPYRTPDVRVINPYLDAAEVEVITGGLLGRWAFSEGSGTSTADLSGNGRTMTLNNIDAGDWVAGPNALSGGMAFGGTDEYGSFASGIPGAHSAIMMWVKLSAELTAASSPLFLLSNEAGSNSGDAGITLGPLSGTATDETLSVCSNAKSAVRLTYARNNIAAGWAHVGFRWDGSKYVPYINGSAVTGYNGTNGACAQFSGLLYYVARLANTYSVITMADVRIYSAALTDTQWALIAAGEG